MGSVDNICSDKTGTLTQNKMTITRLATQGFEYEISSFTEGLLSEELARLLCVGICENSDAVITKNEETGETGMSGNRTECSLMEFASKLGYQYQDYRKPETFITRNPFSSAAKRMSTIVRHEEGAVIFAKGASEIILALCT